jgi:hypothetical protein
MQEVGVSGFLHGWYSRASRLRRKLGAAAMRNEIGSATPPVSVTDSR